MKVLSGTGVCTEAAPAPPADEDPSAAFAVDEGRVVPAREVVALEETDAEVLALDKTVAMVAVLEGDNAAVEVAGEAAAAEVVVRLFDVSADVADEGAAMPAVEAGLYSALPELGVIPDPAPEEEPAVAVVVAPEELLVNED